MKAKTPARGKYALFFCGIGIERPSDVSIRTIQTLKGCDVLFYIHGDGGKLKDFFAAFCADVRTYDGSAFAGMSDSQKIAAVGRQVCRELRRGRSVGYVTYGHPMLFSDADNMAEYCRARDYVGRVIPSSSSLDSIMAVLSEQGNLFTNGYQVCLGDQVLEPAGFRPPSGTLVLLGLDRVVRTGRFKEFCEKLSKHYPPEHLVYGVRCGSGEDGEVIMKVRIDRLSGWNDQVVHMMSFVLRGVSPA